MNVKIRELAEHCTEMVGGTFEVFDKEKFAELLIQECAKVAFRAAPSDESGCDISSAIEDHFGLE